MFRFWSKKCGQQNPSPSYLQGIRFVFQRSQFGKLLASRCFFSHPIIGFPTKAGLLRFQAGLLTSGVSQSQGQRELGTQPMDQFIQLGRNPLWGGDVWTEQLENDEPADTLELSLELTCRTHWKWLEPVHNLWPQDSNELPLVVNGFSIVVLILVDNKRSTCGVLCKTIHIHLNPPRFS